MKKKPYLVYYNYLHYNNKIYPIASEHISVLLQKKFLNSVCQICPSLHHSNSFLMDYVSCQCFSYSSVLEKFRAKALHDKLSDLMQCTSV